MAIERWDPFREMVSLRDAMNSLLQDSFVRPGGGMMPGGGGGVALPLDIAETENEFVVHASLPGVKPEEVQITVHGDTLTIRGETKEHQEKKGQNWHIRERRFGAFQRSVSLNAPIDSEKAKAEFEHGVLTLTLPKAEAAKPKQIKVGGGGNAAHGARSGAARASPARSDRIARADGPPSGSRPRPGAAPRRRGVGVCHFEPRPPPGRTGGKSAGEADDGLAAPAACLHNRRPGLAHPSRLPEPVIVPDESGAIPCH